MRKNSFKELEKLELEEVNANFESIKLGISSDIGFMRHITSIIEMYFPKVLDIFIGLTGGSPSSPEHSGNNNQYRKYPDM